MKGSEKIVEKCVERVTSGEKRERFRMEAFRRSLAIDFHSTTPRPKEINFFRIETEGNT